MDQILVLLIAFIAFAVAFLRIGLGSVLGYLVAGLLIGPAVGNLISDIHVIEAVAELGVIFLLFALGLEIKFDRLRLFGLRAYLLAFVQILVTTGVIGYLGHSAGIALGTAIAIGGALSLSSTAIVLQILTDTGRTVTMVGRTAIAVLLVQDIAVGPLLIGVNILATGGSLGMALVWLLVQGVAVVVLMVGTARYVLPPVLRIVARLDKPELFMATTLLIVLASSWATHEVGISAALGAFMAGLLVADTEYRHQIMADIAPFRGLLVGLFFMTVGIKTDVSFALAHPGTVLAITGGLIGVKLALILVGAAVLRYPFRVAAPLSVLLAQGSEFSFVVLGLMAVGGLLPKEVADLFVIAVALSMLVTPLAAAAGRRFLDRWEGQAQSSLTDLDTGTAELHNHIVVIGFGQVGMALSRHMIGMGIPVLVIDFDPHRVRGSQKRKLPVFFGNATRSDVLRAAHVGQARMVVVTTPEDVALRIVELVKRMYPKVPILARATDTDGAQVLRRAGAGMVALDGMTTAIDLAERVITLYSLEEDDLPPPPSAGSPTTPPTVEPPQRQSDAAPLQPVEEAKRP